MDCDTDRVFENCRLIIEEIGTRDEKLEAICDLIKGRISGCDWVGFYVLHPLKKGVLKIGPYIGDTTEHVEIPFGRGICGTVADTKETLIVEDVSQVENYLSCSVNVKSEIVVPIMKGGKFVGELDIDSHTEGNFTDEHKVLFEGMCEMLAEIF